MTVKIELEATPQSVEAAIPYFSLQLDSEILVLIGMQYAQEILVMSAERLTLMPNMPGYILGLVHHRNHVFWVIDLPQMLGLNPLYIGTTEYSMTILRVQDFWVGLAGGRSQGVKRFSKDRIVSPIGNVSVELERYLQGCIHQAEGISLVLDAEAIAMPIKSGFSKN